MNDFHYYKTASCICIVVSSLRTSLTIASLININGSVSGIVRGWWYFYCCCFWLLFCQFVSYNSFVSSIPGNAPPSPFLPSPFLPCPFPPPNGSGRGNVCLLTRRDTVLTGKTDASNEGVVRYIDYPRQATARVVCCPTLHMARPVYVYLYRAAAITGQRRPAVALPTSKHSAVNRSSCIPAPRSTESTLHNRRNVQRSQNIMVICDIVAAFWPNVPPRVRFQSIKLCALIRGAAIRRRLWVGAPHLDFRQSATPFDWRVRARVLVCSAVAWRSVRWLLLVAALRSV